MRSNLPVVLEENSVIILAGIVGVVVIDLPSGRQPQQQGSHRAAIALTEAALLILLRAVAAVKVQPAGRQAWSTATPSDLREFVTEVPRLLAAAHGNAGREIKVIVGAPAIAGSNYVGIEIQTNHRSGFPVDGRRDGNVLDAQFVVGETEILVAIGKDRGKPRERTANIENGCGR